MNEEAPPRVGPYQPDRLLAAGGQAQVWLARGPTGDVALKLARSEEHRASLEREAAALQRCSHPHIVRLVDRDPEHTWIALEYIHGAPVDQWAQFQSLQAILDAAREITDALSHLHERGVVHGDLKPRNVLVSPVGDVKLIDLGIAQLPGSARTGFRGTLGYAAPEQLRGEQASPRTDLYNLGALLYACVSGRPPFVAPDPAALTYLPLVSLPPPPSAFRVDLPRRVNQLLLALLAREPRRRPTLDRVRSILQDAGQDPPGAAVLGMMSEREEIRQAVVGASDGEARVVSIYGPPGSGRRTLVTEAVEYARREGLPYLKATDPARLLSELASAARPPVVVGRARVKRYHALARAALEQGRACLILLVADRPAPSLAKAGALQLTPSPLSEQDAVRLASLQGADPDLAKRWWREAMGLPIGIVGRIRAWKRQQTGAALDPGILPIEARAIWSALSDARTAVPVPELAQQLGLGEHTLLDHCEVLFAERAIEAVQAGAALRISSQKTSTP